MVAHQFWFKWWGIVVAVHRERRTCERTWRPRAPLGPRLGLAWALLGPRRKDRKKCALGVASDLNTPKPAMETAAMDQVAPWAWVIHGKSSCMSIVVLMGHSIVLADHCMFDE